MSRRKVKLLINRIIAQVRTSLHISDNATNRALRPEDTCRFKMFRSFAQDQWEVTRAAALDGIFAVSPAEAKPYVEAALGDSSQLVQQYAHHLWSLYQQQNK